MQNNPWFVISRSGVRIPSLAPSNNRMGKPFFGVFRAVLFFLVGNYKAGLGWIWGECLIKACFAAVNKDKRLYFSVCGEIQPFVMRCFSAVPVGFAFCYQRYCRAFRLPPRQLTLSHGHISLLWWTCQRVRAARRSSGAARRNESLMWRWCGAGCE